MNESILLSIKKMLGIEPEYTHFDLDIITNINTAFMTLRQLGVNFKDKASISGETENWTDMIEEMEDLEAIKSYVYLKVRMIFDTPASSNMSNAMKEAIAELEWRINVQVESKVK